MATLLLEIVTPEKTIVKKEVDMVLCPGSEGEFGVLPHHASLLSALKTGLLRYQKGEEEDHIFISGGFVDVNNNICSVLAESAERAEDIDEARAIEARERALARLKEQREEVDMVRAEAALQRAVMRLKIKHRLFT